MSLFVNFFRKEHVMLVREVFVKYSKMVPFPWSPSKIKRAGHNPTTFLIDFGKEFNNCPDRNTDENKELINLFKELQLL